MSRTCLVLGGNGFVGSAIMRAAEKHGWTATNCGRNDHERLAGSEWDLIINANGNSKKYLSDREPLTDFDLSVRSVAESLHNYKTNRYVFLSTVDVYPDKSNPDNNSEDAVIDPAKLSRYGLHKWLAEQLVLQSGKDWLILRMAGFVGKGLKKNPIFDLLNGAELRVHPESAYQYQDSDHLADRVFLLVEQGVTHQIVNAAGDGTITIKDIAAMIDGAELAEPSADLPKEHYEINISRMKSLCQVEQSSDVVGSFVKNVQSGALKLS